ncbi:hypothetical protein BVRB_6g142120 [Beta vulgaris subsp. vulgaris]|nr:hypothetical protein BVRB_6g142120 [Beta vulgaris subsp. vulgaris]
MQIHLLVYVIDNGYNPWVSHGELVELEGETEVVLDNEENETEMPFDDMAPLIFEATNAWNSTTSSVLDDNRNNGESDNHEYPKELMTLVEDMEAELYPGCTTFKRLEFIISLLHNKVSNKWSDKSFSMLLKTLPRAFTHDKDFPANAYEAKKYTKALGLDYVKIDACVNHCILFQKEFANEEKCPKCLAPRWKEKVVQGGDEYSDGEDVQKTTRVPQLILHHFPLIPRLQRMFIFSKLARHMRWHKDDKKDDGIMRRPADSKAWKSLDKTFSDFSKDARNIRLGLASDGFNPGAIFDGQRDE